MHKLGLKLYSTNESYLEDAAAFYERGVYDFIELLPVPGSGEIALARWKALRAPYVIHAPHFSFGVNLARRELFGSNMAAARATLRWAEVLGAPYAVFHPGTDGEILEAARQLKEIGDPRVLVENKPYRTVDGRFRCVGCSHEEIRSILETAGTGFCLDIGHAISYARNIGADWYSYLLGFLDLKPDMYHVSDGIADSGLDTHDHIGTGDYDWGRILPLIPDGAFVTVETRKDAPDGLADFAADAGNLRARLAPAPGGIVVRRMTAGDSRRVFELSNDPFVRRYSVQEGAIPWESHEAWFRARLEDPSCDLFAAEVDGQFAGQVRYHPDGERMVVSLSIAAPFRGRGLASGILRSSARLAFEGRPGLEEITAFISPENHASARAFAGAGYLPSGRETMAGRPFDRYSLRRGRQ